MFELSIAIHVLNITIVPEVYKRSGLTKKHLEIFGSSDRKIEDIVKEMIQKYENMMKEENVSTMDKLLVSVHLAALLTHFPHLDNGEAKKFMVATWKSDPNITAKLQQYKKLFDEEYEKFKK